ncbi:MAG: phosphatase PAP2 family protein [Candidatus Pacebacteria bacterium]|nr:phosphatase PAP2 family protein [Candidatus Paceibacterota bacterium]
MNEKIFYYLNNFALQNELFDTLVIFIADWLIWWMFFGIIVLFLYKQITINQFLKIIFCSVIIWGISWVTKQLYFSPRPFLELSNVKLLFEHGFNNSMPSGHTVLATSLAMTTYLYNKKAGVAFLLCSVLVGLSRIVVGIHWPLDILIGLLLGVTGILILNKFLNKFDFHFV